MKIIITTIGILFILGILLAWAKCCLPILWLIDEQEIFGLLVGILGAMLTACLLMGAIFVGNRLIYKAR